MSGTWIPPTAQWEHLLATPLDVRDMSPQVKIVLTFDFGYPLETKLGGLPHEKGTEKSKLQFRDHAPTPPGKDTGFRSDRRATNNSNCGRYHTNPLLPGMDDYRMPSPGGDRPDSAVEANL
jgi:hypothetical protein